MQSKSRQAQRKGRQGVKRKKRDSFRIIYNINLLSKQKSMWRLQDDMAKETVQEFIKFIKVIWHL